MYAKRDDTHAVRVPLGRWGAAWPSLRDAEVEHCGCQLASSNLVGGLRSRCRSRGCAVLERVAHRTKSSTARMCHGALGAHVLAQRQEAP
jgi:hypothetical protein